MNFWRTFGIHTVSAIETILDKEKFTLEELLEEDELLQECRSENAKLLAFLTLPATLERLFDYITVEPEATADSVRKFKYPFLACEILCSDVWAITEAVSANKQLVDRLYGFLERPAPLSAPLAAHVSKVAAALLEKKAQQTLSYLRQREGLVDNFIRHLSSSAVMDLLLKIISCEEEGGGTLDWLCQHSLITKLVDKFAGPQNNETPADVAEVHEHAAQALADIIQVSVLNKSSPLMAKLESADVVESLLGHMFSGSTDTALYYGLDVMTELVKRNVLESFNGSIALDQCPAALRVIVHRLPQLESLLLKEGPAQLTTMGPRIPLGFTRLKVVQFCIPLFFTNYGAVDAALADSNLLKVIFDLFFSYEWNNFLHQHVEGLVGTLFDGSAPALRRAAVERFHLPSRLAAAAKMSDDRFSGGGLRAGHHGFVVLAGQHIANWAAKDTELQTLLDKEDQWKEFVEGALRESQQLVDMNPPIDSDSEKDAMHNNNGDGGGGGGGLFGNDNDNNDVIENDLNAVDDDNNAMFREWGLVGPPSSLVGSGNDDDGGAGGGGGDGGDGAAEGGDSGAGDFASRYRFGGWQDNSDSDSSGEDAASDEEGDVAAATQAAVEELKQLKLQEKQQQEQQQQQQQQQLQDPPLDHQVATSYIPPLVVTNVITDPPNGAQVTTDNSNNNNNNNNSNNSSSSSSDSGGGQFAPVADGFDDVPASTTSTDPATPPSAIPPTMRDRFQEVGNSYGTPPPEARKEH